MMYVVDVVFQCNIVFQLYRNVTETRCCLVSELCSFARRMKLRQA